jgi:glycosyltransferase involved in cell wall biosynthesis
MRVLYIISNSTLNPEANTGYARHIRETVKGLKALGHEVMLLKSGNEPLAKKGQTQEPRRFQLIKKLVPKIFWESLKDLRLIHHNNSFKQSVETSIRQFSPEIVYERTSYLTDTISVNKKFKLPWILEVNAPFVEQRIKLSGSSLLQKRAHKYELEKYNAASAIFCVSGVLARYIKNSYTINVDKLVVNHNGVDPEDFKHEHIKKQEKSIIFGFVGSVMRYHGIEELISAFYQVEQKHPNVKLIIVGDGQSLSQLEDEVKRLNLSEKVEFTGGLSHELVSKKMDEMDVYVLPNTAWYCSPIKLFEYGIMGKLVIAPDLPPVQEVMTHKHDGILCIGKDQLIDSMQHAIENYEELLSLGANFKAKVETNYTWASNVNRINEKMKELTS